MSRSKFATIACATALLLLAGLLSQGCRTSPVTERKQLLIVPEDYERELGLSSYEKILSEQPVSTNAHYTELVSRVGQRIAAVADRPDYDWEFQVIATDVQNAFALPGGKVAVYEGMLPICATESGLAVVMSHEIAHALARHGGERMSQKVLVNAAGNVLKYATQDKREYDQQLLLDAYGAASKYGVALPFSRKHESEADRLGLMLMAKAGYDPRVAPLFWERFSSQKQKQDPPEFLSTHPADQRRAEDLRKLLPQAIELYQQAHVQYGDGATIQPPRPS